MGYQVTIFEASGIAGGIMFHGIPEFRLPRRIIEKEVEKIEELGVEFKYNSPLNTDFGLSELREQGYKAVFLSVGVQKGRDLNIEGADLDGVIKAVDYLININNGYRVDLGKKVLVIGGGFVAFDAARLALRTGLTVPVFGEPTRFILLGGTTIEQATLIRFYVLHCFVLPVLTLYLISYHVWRIRKDGGLACVDKRRDELRKEEMPPVASKTYSLLGITGGTSVDVQNVMIDEEKEKVPSSPNLTMRLAVVTLATTIVSILLTLIVRAPLEEAANPAVTPNPAKAPWYFLWLQELVTITTFTIGGITINGALIGGIILPGVLVLAAVLFPYFDKSPAHTTGKWLPKERKWQNTVFLIIVAAILILTFIGTFMRGPYWNLYMPWEQWEQIPHKF